MKGFAETVLIVAIVGFLAALALSGCMPSDAGQCRPHSFTIGC